MKSLPHDYRVRAAGTTGGTVTVSCTGLPSLVTTPPPEFGGPEGYWSPETLFVAAVADCYILSFRAVARHAGLDWVRLRCDVEARLEKDDQGVVRFTRLVLRPVLELPDDADRDQAQDLLGKAKRGCLVSNSLNAEIALETELRVCELA